MNKAKPSNAMSAASAIMSFFLLCMACSTANAQIRFANLQEVWNYADKHNIQIKTSVANKDIADYNVKQAYGSMLPTMSANGGFTDNIQIQSTLVPANLFNPVAPAGTYTEATFGRRYIYNGSITAQFDLLNTQDWFAVKAAKVNKEIASVNIAKARAELYEQLTNAYFSYVLLCEAEKLSRDNAETAGTVYELAANKFNAGLISEITVNTALINKQKAEKSLALAVQNKAIQLNNLKLSLNIQDSLIISERLDTNVLATDTGSFVNDPGIQLAYGQMLLSKNQLNSSRAAFSPTLSAIYQYSTQIAGDDFLRFDNSNTTPQQYWGLRLSVPIFTGNVRRYQVKKAKIDYQLKEAQYENALQQSAINDQNILLSHNSSLIAYGKSKGILALYQKNDAHAQRRMKEGIISLDDRLKYYSDLIANQNEYLQSMSDYFIQDYRLKIRQTNLQK